MVKDVVIYVEALVCRYFLLPLFKRTEHSYTDFALLAENLS